MFCILKQKIFVVCVFVLMFTAGTLHAGPALKSEDVNLVLQTAFDSYKGLQEGAIADISNALGGNPYAYQPQ